MTTLLGCFNRDGEAGLKATCVTKFIEYTVQVLTQ